MHISLCERGKERDHLWQRKLLKGRKHLWNHEEKTIKGGAVRRIEKQQK